MSVNPSFKSLTAFLILLIISSIGGMVYGETSLPVLEKNVDLIWIVAAATMVFFMQIGFTAFETGSVQAKNAISVALKNVIVFLLCSVFFFFSGFALMFGDSTAGLVGASHFLFWGLEDIHLGYAFAFFQVVFAGTAATIITGAMCERTRIFTHIWSSILIICVIYPIFGHWAWGGNLHYGQAGWLQRMGFIDFAGSTVVHSIGGWFALAGALVVGPRIGKYNPDGSVNPIGAHNIPLATLGTLFLWFGWFGFNGGSTLKASAAVGITILNTNIAAGAGGATALLFAWLLRRRFDASSVLLGILGGLVAITAGSNRVEPWGALVIGIVAAILVILGGIFIERILKIDDPVGAVTVHGIGGVVGTIALALLAPQNTLMVPYQSRLLQVGVQFLGVTVAFAWAFGLGLLFFWSINKLIRLRVRPEEERQGLNLAEYEDVASWLNLVQISRLQDLNVVLEERIKGRTQELSREKRYTESVIKSMKESLVVTDTQGNIRDVNPTIEALLGYKREELVGKPLSILVPEEDVFFREQMLRRLLEGEGIIHDYRTDYLTKDKDTVPVLFTGSIMKDDSGRPLGMVGIARDMRETLNLIKDLQRINQELGTFSEKLQTVMRSVRVPIATLDVERRVLSVNPAFEELTGWRMEEISGKQYDILLSLAVSRTHAFAGELEPVFIGKAVVTDRGGKRIDVSYTEAPLKDFQGNIIGSVSTMEDITREIEVDRMKSEFISTVSHELRTPLTSIKGYVDLILEGDAGETNETQREFLQIVAQSTNRLGDLVNDLLDVERIESGRIQLRREPVDIGVIIYHVIRTFSKEIEKKGISLYTAVPKTLPMVLGDRERIEQVLANLVSNAIKYNIPSGCIKVAAGLEDNFVKVDVMDSGLGISEEDQRRLFQKFFRAGSAKTLEEGGTGLGLSIVKSIVEALGGKVRVKSKLREGSTFTVLLPTEKPSSED